MAGEMPIWDLLLRENKRRPGRSVYLWLSCVGGTLV
jgi:hypothetical protein